MLKNASTICFIDPYFFTNDRFYLVYKEFFHLIASANHVRVKSPPREIKVICGIESIAKKEIPYEEFKNSCEQKYKNILGQNLILKIYRIKTGLQEVHDRFILTNIGGAMVGHGFDKSSKSSSETSIALLEQNHVQHLLKKYTPDSPDFDWSESPIIIS